MKKTKDIELLGMGNGLVDIQYKLDFDSFEKLNLPKGEMRLITPEKQKTLLEQLSTQKPNICSGGSAANSVIAFSQFGGKSAYFTSLGNDELGKFYSNEFTNLNIELIATYLDELPTGTCLVLITPDSERTMLTCLGASALFSLQNIKEEIISRSEWLYVEGFKLSEQKSTESAFYAIELAKKYDTKVAFNLSDVFIIRNFAENVQRILKDTNLLFCNEQEALLLTETTNISDAIVSLKKLVPNFCVTLGAKGSVLFINSNIINIEAYETNVIDTTGAGDMYAGAFMYGLIKWDSPLKAGKFASYASSAIVSQLGARLSAENLNLKENFIILDN